MKKLFISYQDIISMDNLLLAWREFIKGKKSKPDVLEFSLDLIDNILQLHQDLANRSYSHGGYKSFYITDPKLRHIHKAGVRDRLLHHAVYHQLYPFFAKIFIADSYSCQLGKGTHKAIKRFRALANKVSQNNTRTCWILKCDIKKFFANIDHSILLRILQGYIPDQKIIWLLQAIIRSFNNKLAKGLPLGNLTSQLFVNIYMNEFDQFVKHRLKAKYYIRYADDFVIISENRNWLVNQIAIIQDFLNRHLRLTLHSRKVSIQTLASGVDFLGWVHFPCHCVLRTSTKRRMIKRIKAYNTPETIQSYLGLLQHGNAHKLMQGVLNNTRQ